MGVWESFKYIRDGGVDIDGKIGCVSPSLLGFLYPASLSFSEKESWWAGEGGLASEKGDADGQF